LSELSRELADLAGSWIVTETATSVAASFTGQVAVANPARWGIFVCVMHTAALGNFNWSTVGIPPVDNGQQAPAADGPLFLNYRAHGALVQQNLFIRSSIGVGHFVNVMEILAQQ
jgi:hypothetical protein